MHTCTPHKLSTLADDELLREAGRLVRGEREAAAALVRVLIEVDARRLYLREGCSSLFVWCVQVLGLEEGASYNRIEVARAARRLPAIVEELERGLVGLTAVRLLAPHLTASNHREVLARARGLKKREVQRLVAELAPRPPVAATIRRLPAVTAQSSPASRTVSTDAAPGPTQSALPATVPATAAEQTVSRAMAAEPCATPIREGTDGAPLDNMAATTPVMRDRRGVDPSTAQPDAADPSTAAASGPVTASAATATIVPLSPTRFKLQVTIVADTHEKLRLAQDLLRHTVPDGDLSEVLDRALTVLVRQLERQRFAATATPRPSRRSSATSRYIPASVRRAVWQRDGGQCAFVGRQGRCRERAWLEFHHTTPYAAGGGATVENISLRCRAHNAFEAELFFGSTAATLARAHDHDPSAVTSGPP